MFLSDVDMFVYALVVWTERIKGDSGEGLGVLFKEVPACQDSGGYGVST